MRALSVKFTIELLSAAFERKTRQATNLFHLSHADAEPVLRVLSVQADRIHGHHILRVPQEEDANHLAAFVPPLADAAGNVDSGQIPGG